jgi:hypothetical protein
MYSVVKYQDLGSKNQNPYFSRSLLIKVLYQNLESDFQRRVAEKIGGDDRNRTCDPLNANQVLSQLSYIPIFAKEIGCGDRI